MIDSSDDPVLTSVAAYDTDPTGYANKYLTHRRHLPEQLATQLVPNSEILDLGCGPGRDLDIFKAHGHRAIGVELNNSFFAMCTERHEVVHTDIRRIRHHFTAESFDAVWAQSSLVHLSPAETHSVLADCHLLLRPHGLMYLSVPMNGTSGWVDEIDGRRWYTVWTHEDLVHALESTGFIVTDFNESQYAEVWTQKAT